MEQIVSAEASITVILNQLVQGDVFMVEVVRFFAIGAIFIIAAVAFVSLVVNVRFIRVSGKLFFIESILAGTVSWTVNQMISFAVWRARPFAAYPDAILSFVDKSPLTKSFPSDHAAVAMSLAVVIYLWSPRAGMWFMLLAVLIGIARIFAGIHYPSDIIAGLFIGALVGYGIHKLFT